VGSSTVLLVLKSLLPFLKEILLKDRLLRELLLENKVATILAGCVFFLFILVAHVSEIATESARANDGLKLTNSHLLESNQDLKDRVAKLEEELRELRLGPPSPEGPSEHHLPQPPEPVVQPKTAPKKKKQPQSLRSQIELRFKTFE